ncbi:hypothetical protein PUN28_017348 [Cardiocondyla obscurior]|uniref:Uncharacterized protein n=1 Tax=Cardiocondyla obscurior TaxID=286306 RepID=A0AAW2EN22_9HYME
MSRNKLIGTSTRRDKNWFDDCELIRKMRAARPPASRLLDRYRSRLRSIRRLRLHCLRRWVTRRRRLCTCGSRRGDNRPR